MTLQKKIFKQFFYSLLTEFADGGEGVEFELLSKYIDELTPKETEPFYSRTQEFLEVPKPKPKSSGGKRKRGKVSGRGRARKSTIGRFRSH